MNNVKGIYKKLKQENLTQCFNQLKDIMTDLSIEILEKLVLGEDKRAVLKEVTPHSEQARFLELLIDFHEGKQDGLQKKLDDLLSSGGLSAVAAKKLWMMNFFSVLSNAEDKSQPLKELAEKLKLEFSFPKPERVQGLRYDLIADSKDKISSELQKDQLAQIQLQDFLAKLYSEKSCTLVDKLNTDYFHRVNLTKFSMPADKNLLIKFFDLAPKLVEIEGAEAIFLELTKLKHENINWWNKFSTEQKQRFLKNNEVLHTKSYFEEFVRSKFFSTDNEPIFNKTKTYEEQADFLKKKVDFLKAAPKKYERLYSSALAEFLTLNVKQRIFDEVLFLEYLRHPGRTLVNCNQEYQQQYRQYEEKNKLESFSIGTNFINDQSFVTEHLMNLLKTETDVQKYVEFFDLFYLNKLLVEARLLRGEEVPEAANLINQDKLKELHNKTVIDLRGNPLQFTPGEEISLSANLKNVRELRIRVFEINTLNYLLEKRNINYDTIQLSGLIPLQEEVHTYTQRPIEEHQEKFAFPVLKNKTRGVFIIEFIGGEFFAKAVIRLGWLRLIYDKVIGHTCVLLDESGKICKGEKTGLFIKNKFFSSSTDGMINLPSNVENVNDSVVVCHEGFADFCQLMARDNNFVLTAHYIYNQEQFVPGNQISIQMTAALFNNGSRFAISRLVRPELEVKVINESNVENIIPIKNVELSANKDFGFSFLLPTKIHRIELTLKGAVKLATDELKLSTTKIISINRQLGDFMSAYYLKKDAAEEYTLQVLGLNGEPQKGKMLTVTFNPRFISEESNFKLMSDSLGKVYLHKLDDVRSFNVKGEDGSSADFSISADGNSFYPNEMITMQNQKVSFQKETTRKPKLYKVLGNGNIESDLSKTLTVSDNHFEFTLSEPGMYNLIVGSESINIICLKGEKLSALDGYITTGNVTVEAEADGGHLGGRVVKVGDHFEGEITATKGVARAYLLTYNYHPRSLESLKLSRGNTRNVQIFSINPVENKYTSQAALGDELVYVSERKNRKNYMGNTLDKPGIILKRQKVSDTTEGDQQVRPPGEPRAQATRISRVADQNNYNIVDAANYIIDELPFLAQPGKLQPLEVVDGKFKIGQEATSGFTIGKVLIHDGVSSVLLSLFTQEQEIQKNSLALKESRKEGCAYAYERNINYLAANESKTFTNIANVELSLIGDVSSLWDTITLIREGGEDLSAWKFIAEWQSLTPMDKLKNYDKYCSHELNIFTFYKDPEFFFDVVFPFISNKKEKTIIDYFLLKHYDALTPFCNVGNLEKLSLLEIVFLCIGVNQTKPKFSAAIRSFLKSKASLNKVPIDKRKRLFDSVLSTKSEKDNVTPLAPPVPGPTANTTNSSSGPGGFPPIPQPGFPSATQFSMLSNIAPMNAFSNVGQRTMGLGGQSSMRARQIVYGAPPQQRGYGRSIQQTQYGFGQQEEAEVYLGDMDVGADEQLMNRRVPVYTASQSTTEYKERKFFFESQNNSIEDFWVDFCEHLCKEGKNVGFSSENYIYACNSASKAIVILAVTDLGFKSTAPRYERDGSSLQFFVSNPTIVFSKQIIDEVAEKIDLDVLVAQRFYDPQDQFIIDEESEGAKIEKPISEYIVGKVYGSRIVVTNSTTTELNLTLIYEIPQGAISIGSSDQMKLVTIKIGSFESAVNEFKFYFPSAGTFSIYPATVTKGKKLVATANITKVIEVKETLTVKKDDTIVDILSTGDFDDIIKFIRAKNILNPNIFQFDQIYWLLKNKEFYVKLIEALREKGIYDNVVWAFSLYHGDLTAFKEYVYTITKGQLDDFKYLVNDFVNIRSFDYREYYPLVNPRAHALGGKKENILNQSFKNTYRDYLLYLLDKWTVEPEDRIVLTDYLILQDRMEEAMNQFSKITAAELAKIETRIQYDYLAAYIDFLNGYPTFEVAKKLVDNYVVYPVLSWRNLFVEIANQLAEFEEREQLPQAEESKKQTNQDKAKKSANFNCEISNDVIRIESDRINSFTIKYYKIDLEVIFSQNPFRNNTDAAFTFVQPYIQSVIEVAVKETTSTILYHIPKILAKESLFIELNHNEEGATKSKFLEYSPFLLNHSLNQEFGIIKVVDPSTHKPIPKIYVKCFAKYKNGSVVFYKDGYTDIRGSFDYASLSKDKIDDVEKFSLLITSPDFGSKIVQIDPPVKIGKEEGEAKQLISKAFEQQRMTKKALCKNAYAAVY